MRKFSSGSHLCLLRSLLWILNLEFIHYCFLKENHISIHNSCSLISASQLYACTSYVLSDIHENGNYSFTLKKKVKFDNEKTCKAFKNQPRSLLDPVTILATQFIEISIIKSPLISKSSQSLFYSGSQSLKNFIVFHAALAFSLPHGSNIGPAGKLW